MIGTGFIIVTIVLLAVAIPVSWHLGYIAGHTDTVRGYKEWEGFRGDNYHSE
jgi:hypothetical protein